MRPKGSWGLAALLLAAAVTLFQPHAFASTSATGTMTAKWNTQALVKLTLTPNYASGFGQIPATIGTQPAPTHGPDATLGGGSVDFGHILAGQSYIYRYATHLNVTSNSVTGLYVYGEGAANFFNTADSTTQSLSQTVYWLKSVASGDTNTGFSPATPFQLTGGMVTNNGQFTTPSIAYTTYPTPISQSSLANTDFYYDYQLKVPVTATSGLYYVWIVYTVVSQ